MSTLKNHMIALSGVFVLITACSSVNAGEPMAGADKGSDVAYSNVIVAPGTAKTLANPFHPVKVFLSKTESAGAVTFYEFVVPPQSPGSPPHTHVNDDEYFFVTSGTLDVLSGDQTLKLQAGGFAALNRGTQHMFWNGGEETVTLIMATTGGTFEEFFGEVAPTLAKENPASPQAAGAIMQRLAAEHGITISMEAMPEAAAKFYQ